MSNLKFPLVLSDAYNIMKMSVAFRAYLFLFISAAHLGNACTAQHAYRNIVAGTGAPRMNAQLIILCGAAVGKNALDIEQLEASLYACSGHKGQDRRNGNR